jgi:hypothetical protein
MTTLGLRITTRFIDPAISPYTAYPAVVSGGKVVVGKQEFVFSGEGFPDGASVQVRYSSSGFVCELVSDIEHAKELAQEKASQAAADQVKAITEQAAMDAAFNQALRLPVEWRPYLKPVLSGLSAQSNGSGHNKRSVIHVQVLAPLKSGRLERQVGQLLCNSGNGVYGHDGDEIAYGRVTCPQCLAHIAKLTA